MIDTEKFDDAESDKLPDIEKDFRVEIPAKCFSFTSSSSVTFPIVFLSSW